MALSGNWVVILSIAAPACIALLGAVVVLGAALAKAQRTIDEQTRSIISLALRKTYFMVETDERGVRQIAPLQAEKVLSPMDLSTSAPVEIGADHPLPAMQDPDLQTIGTRR